MIIKLLADETHRAAASPPQPLAMVRAVSMFIGRAGAGRTIINPAARMTASVARRSGVGVITGSVEVKGNPENTPVVRPVRLYQDDTGEFLRETKSLADGSYSFSGLDPMSRYFVVSFYMSSAYRAVVADNLKPEVTP